MSPPLTVSVAIPVYNEGQHLSRCLDAVAAQTYGHIVETLVVDGRSQDDSREIASRYAGVRVIDNPDRRQAQALNRAIAEARGEILVRVDGHSIVAPDYVERCITVLERTGAAMVGGGMTPVTEGDWFGKGVALAMRSRFGAGPARFHVGGPPGWVDTVYLGAYRVDVAKAVGGYSTAGVSEDGEFAIRMGRSGGVYYDPSIRSAYVPRNSIQGVATQFYRYGRMRARTVRVHPRSLKGRQLMCPVLILGLCSPARRKVVGTYGGFLVVAALLERHEKESLPGFVCAVPAMHLAWGFGFLYEVSLLTIRRTGGPEHRAPDSEALC